MEKDVWGWSWYPGALKIAGVSKGGSTPVTLVGVHKTGCIVSDGGVDPSKIGEKRGLSCMTCQLGG
eukprot:761680-Hanusia_phi.AAC.1